MNLGVWCIAKKQNKDGKQEAVLQVKKKKKKSNKQASVKYLPVAQKLWVKQD